MNRTTGPLLASGIALFLGACQAPSGASAPTDSHSTTDESSIGTALPRGRSLLVESSLRVRPGPHFRPALGDDGEQGVIVLEGLAGITLDLDQVILNGRPAGTPPDEAFGVGLLIRSCEEIVVRGGSLSGYRVPVLVESSRDVRLEGIKILGGFAQRLVSGAAGPDPLDRLWSTDRSRENGEAWAERWGAGILLVDSSRIRVTGCRVRNAQNGLLAVRCEGCEINGNDFSYLSGWGVALDRSERCRVTGNRCDFVARGYLYGRYAADFGATGILLHGGSSENVLAGNTATHSTCGARELAEGELRGTGNRWFGNDFSWATRASAELVGAQDSWFVANRLVGGPGEGVRIIRGRRLVVHGNRIENILGSAVSIDAGSECVISENRLVGCDHGLLLVGDPAASEGEAPGAEHRIVRNRFRENLQDLVLEAVRGLCFWENHFQEVEPRVHLVELRGEAAPELTTHQVWEWLRGAEGFLPSGRALDCELRAPGADPSPALAEVRSWKPAPPYDQATVLDFEPLPETEGLAGLILGEYGPWDPRGSVPRPEVSSLAGVLGDVEWHASWFAWDSESDPRGDLERWRSLRYEPLQRGRVVAWSDPWGGSPKVRERVGSTSFGLLASGELIAPRDGTYILTVVSDDGLRVRIDGEIVLEDWSWHPARRESRRIVLSSGSHDVDLEYFQLDGAAVLSVELALAPDS